MTKKEPSSASENMWTAAPCIPDPVCCWWLWMCNIQGWCRDVEGVEECKEEDEEGDQDQDGVKEAGENLFRRISSLSPRKIRWGKYILVLVGSVTKQRLSSKISFQWMPFHSIAMDGILKEEISRAWTVAPQQWERACFQTLLSHYPLDNIQPLFLVNKA